VSEKKSILELMQPGPIYSDVFEYRGQKVKFRLLDTREMDWCRPAAQSKVLKNLLAQNIDKDVALVLLKEHGPNADSHVDWQESFALAACLCKEDGSPVTKAIDPQHQAEEIADTFTPIEKRDLTDRYLEFADEHDPSLLTDDEEAELIDDVKKNQDPISLKLYGSNALRNCVLTMGKELVRLAIENEELTERLLDAEADRDLGARLAKLEAVITPIAKS
jgi:hypothetical protein